MSEPGFEDSIFTNISVGMSTSMMDFHQCMFQHAKDYLAGKRAELTVKLEEEMEDLDDEEKKEYIDEEIEQLVWHYNELADRCYRKIGYDQHAETLATAMSRLLIASALMGKDVNEQMTEISQQIRKEEQESYAQCVSITESIERRGLR